MSAHTAIRLSKYGIGRAASDGGPGLLGIAEASKAGNFPTYLRVILQISCNLVSHKYPSEEDKRLPPISLFVWDDYGCLRVRCVLG